MLCPLHNKNFVKACPSTNSLFCRMPSHPSVTRAQKFIILQLYITKHLSRSYAPIIVTPPPPSTGIGWGLGGDLSDETSPRGRAFDKSVFMQLYGYIRAYKTCLRRTVWPLVVRRGMVGDLQRHYCSYPGAFVKSRMQIPTFPHLGPYWGGGRDNDRRIHKINSIK